MKKLKDYIITYGFVSILIITCFANIIIKDKNISTIERRRLTQIPKISIDNVSNGNLIKEFEKYAVDQFEFRNEFRRIKSKFSTQIFKNKDDNKMFEYNGGLYKIEYPLNENAVENNIKKIKKINEQYLKNNNVYYMVIPDKNYYLPNENYLKMDYEKLKKIINTNIEQTQNIDIWNDLNLEDFYKTDIHWKQENLEKIENKIKQKMNLESNEKYDTVELGNFYGTYYGQLGVKVNPDKIYVLNNDTIKNAITYNYEKNIESKIYDLEKYKKSMDKYDVYVSGATSLMDIENKNSKTDKELLIFRDSFGSSIAPLLIENYKKITLIDLRYMDSKLLEEYLDFSNQDVIFMYSTLILNQDLLKVN